MTILDTQQKQPREVLDYDIYFKSFDLPDADTLASTAATWANMADPTDVSSLTLGLVTALNAPPRVKVWTADGLHATRYKITVRTTSAAGRVFEDEFILLVKEE